MDHKENLCSELKMNGRRYGGGGGGGGGVQEDGVGGQRWGFLITHTSTGTSLMTKGWTCGTSSLRVGVGCVQVKVEGDGGVMKWIHWESFQLNSVLTWWSREWHTEVMWALSKCFPQLFKAKSLFISFNFRFTHSKDHSFQNDHGYLRFSPHDYSWLCSKFLLYFNTEESPTKLAHFKPVHHHSNQFCMATLLESRLNSLDSIKMCKQITCD